MKLVDEKGKIFNAINVLDLVIGFIVIGLLFGGYYVYGKQKDSKKETTKIQYQVELKEKEKEVLESVKTGDKIYDSVKNNYIGKVENVKIIPTKIITADMEKNKYVESVVPDKYDEVITISADATVTEKSTKIEDLDIKVGNLINIKGKGYAGTGYVVGLEYK